jgi:hypothetical protein
MKRSEFFLGETTENAGLDLPLPMGCKELVKGVLRDF